MQNYTLLSTLVLYGGQGVAGKTFDLIQMGIHRDDRIFVSNEGDVGSEF